MQPKNLFEQPAFTLTAGELVSLIIDRVQVPQPQIVKQEKRQVRGIHGLAKELSVSPVTIQNWKNSGKIPYSQYGRVVIFDVDAVLSALDGLKKRK